MSRESQTYLYWKRRLGGADRRSRRADTVYTLSIGVGVENYMLKEEMKVMPNPFDGATRVNLSAPANEQALLTIVDMQGRIFARYNTELTEGDNYFNISLSTPQMYILTVQTPTRRQSLKMVNTGHGGTDVLGKYV